MPRAVVHAGFQASQHISSKSSHHPHFFWKAKPSKALSPRKVVWMIGDRIIGWFGKYSGNTFRPPFKLMVGKRMSEPEKVMVGMEGTHGNRAEFHSSVRSIPSGGFLTVKWGVTPNHPCFFWILKGFSMVHGVPQVVNFIASGKARGLGALQATGKRRGTSLHLLSWHQPLRIGKIWKNMEKCGKIWKDPFSWIPMEKNH